MAPCIEEELVMEQDTLAVVLTTVLSTLLSFPNETEGSNDAGNVGMTEADDEGGVTRIIFLSN